jgi:hypothetical protein
MATSLRTATIGTPVKIVHPPRNFEGYTQDAVVIAIEDEMLTVQFTADQVRTCRFYQETGTPVDTRLDAFIVLAQPTRF